MTANRGAARNVPEPSTRFGRYWVGEAISEVGSQVTVLALPLTALTTLGATTTQVATLAAAGFLPYALVGPFAGSIVDRCARQKLLVAIDVASGALLGSVPLAYAIGALSIAQLYLVAFGAATLFVVAAVAHQAIVPELVDRSGLVEANARLSATQATADTVGLGLGGTLVQLLTAPLALLVDAGSFAAAACLTATIRPRRSGSSQRRVRTGTRSSIAIVLPDRRLRPLVAANAVYNIASRGIDALFVVYLTRSIGLQPGELGVAVAATGPGAIIGAMLVSRVARRVGTGRLLIAAQLLGAAAHLALPLLPADRAVALGVLVLSQATLGAAGPLYNVTQLSLRQAIAGDDRQGQVNGAIRFLTWAPTPFAAAFAGVLAAQFGFREALAAAAILAGCAAGPLLAPSLRRVRDVDRETPIND